MFKNWINYFRLKRKYKKVIFGGKGYFEFIENIYFKEFAYVEPDAYWSAKGKIIIGNNVIIGPKSIFWTYSHNYNSENFIPYGPSDEDKVGDIIIEDNVWIGLSVIILPNVRIGEGAVVGMGAVVTKDVPKCAVVVGNPAKVIKYRDINLYDKLKTQGKLYLKGKKKYEDF